VLEHDRGVEGSVPSVSLVVSAAEKIEVAECVEEAAERSEGHLRRVIWYVGEKTKGREDCRVFGSKPWPSSSFCGFSSRFYGSFK
jgi:hypothetical protein